MIVCTGPESSGTRLVNRIVATSGLAHRHRSMPNANDWNLGLLPGDVVVAVRRELMGTARSAVAAGHAASLSAALRRRDAAVALIEDQVEVAGVPVLWIDYEALLTEARWVADQIGEFIGAPVTLSEPIGRSIAP